MPAAAAVAAALPAAGRQPGVRPSLAQRRRRRRAGPRRASRARAAWLLARRRPGPRAARVRPGPAAAAAARVAREIAEADWALAPGEAWPAWRRASLMVGASAALWATFAGAVLLLV